MATRFRKYKISIIRIDEYDAIGREWKQIADTGNEKDGGKVYDYVTYPTTGTTETAVLTQETTDENLDIKNIIKAINGL